jgi:hypothetical protein
MPSVCTHLLWWKIPGSRRASRGTGDSVLKDYHNVFVVGLGADTITVFPCVDAIFLPGSHNWSGKISVSPDAQAITG